MICVGLLALFKGLHADGGGQGSCDGGPGRTGRRGVAAKARQASMGSSLLAGQKRAGSERSKQVVRYQSAAFLRVEERRNEV